MATPVLVSACLLGRACRYDGAAKPKAGLREALAGEALVPVCPEELGGLGTPRPAAELHGGVGADVLDSSAKVLRKVDGVDVSAAFIRGAERALARAQGAERAILKARSPSCGCGQVWREGALVEGDGVFAALLRRRGVTVCSDDDWEGAPPPRG